MQFQKDQSGQAAGAGRAIVQACLHAGPEERGRGDLTLGVQSQRRGALQRRGPRISLLFPCSPLLFSAEIQVLRVFLPIFQFVRPPLQGFTDWGAPLR